VGAASFTSPKTAWLPFDNFDIDVTIRSFGSIVYASIKVQLKSVANKLD
jgi:hypothetical protein